MSVRRSIPLALAGAAVFALAMPGAVRLYAELRTDLRELLPQGAPAAVALDELERRIGSFAQLAVVVRTGNPSAAERFVDALADRLRRLPPGIVRAVRSDVREERAFFEAHGALYADLDDLIRARDAVAAQVRRANPLVVDLDDDAEPPSSAGIENALERVSLAFAQIDRFPRGYLAGEGGSTFIVLVSPPAVAASVESDKALFAAVDREVRAVDPARFSPTLVVGYGGEVKEVLEAQEALVRDLIISSALVLSAVLIAIWLYFRTLRAVPLLVSPLFAGTALTFSLSRLGISHLNPNTAFLGSIIVGNGINPGIILLARYFEERRKGSGIEQALTDSLQGTWLPTLVASGAAAASYGSLVATGFRGFNQFGLMGALGMVVCWVTTYALMPSLIALVDHPRWPIALHTAAGFAAALGRAVKVNARFVVGLTACVAVASAVLLVSLARDPFEYDFSRLGSRRGEIDGAASWNRHMDAVLRQHQSPSAVLVDSEGEARAVSDALDAEKKAEGVSSTIDAVVSLQTLLPDDQPRKLKVLRDLLSMLGPSAIAKFPAQYRSLIERLRKTTRLREITANDVPEALRRPFVERDGRTGRLVLVTPSLEHASARAGKAQIEHARRVRQVAQEAVPGARVAGSLILTADIVGSIVDDGAIAAVLSFAGVLLLTVAMLRSVRQAVWVIGSLCLGVLCLGGAMAALGLRLNFVNFVVLPITFGIGADYAVNLYLRYRQGGGGSPEQAVAASGGAVALCSTTTILGYAALLIADNRAIFSFGLMAVIGEITCLAAALVALPAALALHAARTAGE